MSSTSYIFFKSLLPFHNVYSYCSQLLRFFIIIFWLRFMHACFQFDFYNSHSWQLFTFIYLQYCVRIFFSSYCCFILSWFVLFICGGYCCLICLFVFVYFFKTKLKRSKTNTLRDQLWFFLCAFQFILLLHWYRFAVHFKYILHCTIVFQ